MHAMFLSVDQVRELDLLSFSHTFERIEDGDEWPKILLSHISSKIRAFGFTQLPDILSKAFSFFSSCTRVWCGGGGCVSRYSYYCMERRVRVGGGCDNGWK
jgi:hypothetical protein